VTRSNPPDFILGFIAFLPPTKTLQSRRNRDRTIERFTMVEETKETTPLQSGTSLKVAASNRTV
jgi:hypothetical protein